VVEQRVDFTITQNQPVKVLCDDGTEFVITMVVSAIWRTDQTLPDGQPLFNLRLQPVIEQLAPAAPIDIKNLTKGG
jgi:hypothetical protein